MHFLKKTYLVFLFMAIFLRPVLKVAGQSFTYTRAINWYSTELSQNPGNSCNLSFDGAIHSIPGSAIPFYFERFAVPEGMKAVTKLEHADYKKVRIIPDKTCHIPQGEVILSSENAMDSKTQVVNLLLLPFRINPLNGDTECVTGFTFSINFEKADNKPEKRSLIWKNNSVLASGKWYRVKVRNSGVYKIDYRFLRSLGIIPENTDPVNIQIYGNGGGMLPQLNSVPAPDDLNENAIYVYGEEDHKFDTGDYILFYARGPVKWKYNSSTMQYNHQVNYYSDYSYYFITVGNSPGKRISFLANLSDPAGYLTESYDFYDFHEVNTCTDVTKRLKSGRELYGEPFCDTTSRNFSVLIPNLETDRKVSIISSVAVRSPNLSSFRIEINGNRLTQEVEPVNIDNPNSNFIALETSRYQFKTDSGRLNIRYDYQKAGEQSMAWLNYFEINARAGLVFDGQPFEFRDTGSAYTYSAEYRIRSSLSRFGLWDITNIYNIKETDPVLSGSSYYIRIPSQSSQEFVIFDPEKAFSPEPDGAVSNQNLHSAGNIDMVIVTHPDFLEASEKLADFHRQADGLSVLVVTPQQIYNEFSSGSQDITAIRRFLKMLYDRAVSKDEAPKFLLLMGAASYDYKNILPANTNFVPVYQTLNSYNAGDSYASDDYYGFLDDQEGDWDANGGTTHKLDIAIGRIPARNVQEASGVVNKIIRYRNRKNFGDWRKEILFIADDESYNVFIEDSENLTNYLDKFYPEPAITKYYLDAFRQIHTPAGDKYPDAEKAISDKINSGVLVVNYIGHGGMSKLSSEGVITTNSINAMKNIDRLPFMMTGTCEFARFDDPEEVSAGEMLFLNPNGGVIGLFSTMRVVVEDHNATLLSKVYKDNLYMQTGQPGKYLGNVIMTAKNNMGSDDNTRKFTFLGDPATLLALPEYNIKITSVNNHKADTVADTFRPFSVISMKGEIRNHNGIKQTGFNGTLSVTVFDKKDKMKTLANDPESNPATFYYWKSIIFQGISGVKNGEFSFTFQVPYNIAARFGYGRVSFYANDDTSDAGGIFTNYITGSTKDDSNTDHTGPLIRLFMNDTNFSHGNMTGINPVLLAKISDKNGISLTNNVIGREILCTFDTNETFVLDPYFKPVMDNYREGEISYPFKNLSPGLHRIDLKAWDLAGNSSVATLFFTVSTTENLVLRQVGCYPNPAGTGTTIRFIYDYTPQAAGTDLEILDMTGREIRHLHNDMYFEGRVEGSIRWDGKNDSGEIVKPGFYIYILTLKTRDGKDISQSGKLIIIH